MSFVLINKDPDSIGLETVQKPFPLQATLDQLQPDRSPITLDRQKKTVYMIQQKVWTLRAVNV